MLSEILPLVHNLLLLSLLLVKSYLGMAFSDWTPYRINTSKLYVLFYYRTDFPLGETKLIRFSCLALLHVPRWKAGST
jgi:hypothetical protein